MTVYVGTDTARTRRTLEVQGKSYAYYSIPAAEAAGLGDFKLLPASLKVVLENMLRFEDGKTVTVDDIRAFAEWARLGGVDRVVGVALSLDLEGAARLGGVGSNVNGHRASGLRLLGWT